jgi:hypothetical protein
MAGEAKRQYVTLFDAEFDEKPYRRLISYFQGEPGLAESFTSCCSGCGDDQEGQCCERGSGCRECGYTGKVRIHFFVPLADIKSDIVRLPAGVVIPERRREEKWNYQ